MHDDIAGRGGRRTVVPGVGQPASVEFLDVAVGVIPVLIRQHMRPGLGDTGVPLILHNVAQQRLAAAPCVPAPALPQAVVLCHAVCLRNKLVFNNIRASADPAMYINTGDAWFALPQQSLGGQVRWQRQHDEMVGQMSMGNSQALNVCVDIGVGLGEGILVIHIVDSWHLQIQQTRQIPRANPL